MSASPQKKRTRPAAKKLGSPWLEQLDTTRRAHPLSHDVSTDIAIIGAGIAGITTAYFLLTRTSHRVLLVEGGRVAHGATGHNAGQLVSYFERPFSDIAHEFGLEMAADGQRAVESSWELLEEMRHDLQLKTPCLVFKGYAGCVDLKELLVHLKNNHARAQAGLTTETAWVSETFKDKHNIPRAYRSLYKLASHETILHLLETKDPHYIAVLAGKKGCMNSAQFCEETITILQQRFAKRLLLAEQTPIKTVHLHQRGVTLVSKTYDIYAKRVILCTNGFERLRIENDTGSDIDTKFHHLVRGSVGYMAAFLEEPQMHPTAISYLPYHLNNKAGAYDSDPYYYLTRRPHGKDGKASLICIGGPEALMDDTNNYSKAHPYPMEAKAMINAFVTKTYRHTARKLSYSHLWHGLMGYTPNGIRCVGAEPCNPVLLYNLGCNGVGILPSIYGGFRISQIINGEPLAPSIFDPVDRRCLLPKRTSAQPRITTARKTNITRQHVFVFVILATLSLLAAFHLLT